MNITELYNQYKELLNKDEYISQITYEELVQKCKEVLKDTYIEDITNISIKQFLETITQGRGYREIEEHNNIILDRMYKENKEYFENMYVGIDDNIHLDEEQCKAILADEKYSLIIAGAGTGKTTTMVSKVKYLVDKKNADSKKILVLSYTRKATEEIAKRIENSFNLPVHVTTFHSLGYEYIKEIFSDRKCEILDRNKLIEIEVGYFRKIFEDKKKIKEILENFDIVKQRNRFIFSKYFMENYEFYNTYDEFIEGYVKDKIKEAQDENIKELIENWIEKQRLKDTGITSIAGKYVKSAGELTIANFLYTHGIDYEYEEKYDELLDNNAIYKPDFTIDYAGEKIYIEYFGLDDKEYNRIRKWKENFHKERNNKFIEIEKQPLDRIEEVLDAELKKLNVKYEPVSSEKIYEQILRQNPISQVYPFLNFLRECMMDRKESYYREDVNRAKDYIEQNINEDNQMIRTQYKYIAEFDNYYMNMAFGGSTYYFDFSDLLYYAVKHLERLTVNTNLKFNYIIIDEYQDISQIKYELTFKTAKRNDAKVYAVGDDWQSIYAFSGSRIEYIYRFKEFFKGAKSFNISRTYRNSQELINTSGEFIMKNDDQLKKQLVSDKHINKPIVYKNFNNEIEGKGEIAVLKETIKEIHRNEPNHNILVLGRTNRIIDRVTEDEEIKDDIGSKIVLKNYENIDIDCMTMHKSKGLTYDEVIIIGLNRKFPSPDKTVFWYNALYKNKKMEESISFAEERRLFYVALTRTKNKVYLLVNENEKYRSPFVDEIKSITNAQ